MRHFNPTAQELHEFTITRLTKLPSIYKSYIYDPLSELVNRVMQNVTAANGLSKVDEFEYVERRKTLKQVQADLISMYKYIDFIFAHCNQRAGKPIIKEGSRVEWYRLIKAEQALIAGVIASDRKAFERHQKQGDSTVGE